MPAPASPELFPVEAGSRRDRAANPSETGLQVPSRPNDSKSLAGAVPVHARGCQSVPIGMLSGPTGHRVPDCAGSLMLINGSRDGLFQPEGVKDCFDKLQRCSPRPAYPEDQPINCRLVDTPHEFNPAMQAEAWAWLKKWV